MIDSKVVTPYYCDKCFGHFHSDYDLQVHKNNYHTSYISTEMLDPVCDNCGKTASDRDRFSTCWYCNKGVFRPVEQSEPLAPVISTFDPVNKPVHYNQGKFEVLDVIEDNLKEGFEAYLVGNILKYVMRYKHKNGIQDLEKAEVYLKKLIQKKGEENGNETK